MDRTQVKICGITTPDMAREVASLGPDAVGLVFFEKSPRFVDTETARAICDVLPPTVARVGVFVNLPPEEVLSCSRAVGLTHAQLHGAEGPEDVLRIEKAGIRVIKALFVNKKPDFSMAGDYAPSAYLTECAGGTLPGGNALSWNFSDAAKIPWPRPVLLAGGLNPQNVSSAIEAARPDAVDVSSGVEGAPGIKDIQLVRQFIEAVQKSAFAAPRGRVFP